MSFENISMLAQNSSSTTSSVFMWAIVLLLIVVTYLLMKPSKSSSPDKNGGILSSNILKAEDIVVKNFQPTKFREGYAQDSVDQFLERVVVEFRRLQEESARLQTYTGNTEEKPLPIDTPTMTPADVVNQKFKPTKFSEGYDQDEVDDYLDKIVMSLRHWSTENEALYKQNS